MRRGLTILLSLVFLLAASGLLMLWRQVMPRDAETMGEVVLSEIEPTTSPGEMVPVTTVQEAWDEHLRQILPEKTSPQPVKVEEDAVFEIRNETGYEIDLKSLPALPVAEEGEALVLIMHTHGSESYDNGSGSYRSQDETQSVIAVGEVIRKVLEEKGYGVIHDKTLCDYPEYNGAYNRSRTVIQRNLEENPSIFLVLDIHRDAIEDEAGIQRSMDCLVEGETAAQLMLVVGTDAGGLEHSSWETNLALGVVLQLGMGEYGQGLMRPLNLRTERFNQDLAPMTLLLEVGASGNTLKEAKVSAKLFGEALSEVLDRCCGKSS